VKPALCSVAQQQNSKEKRTANGGVVQEKKKDSVFTGKPIVEQNSALK
jgi:hypothetical protein